MLWTLKVTSLETSLGKTSLLHQSAVRTSDLTVVQDLAAELARHVAAISNATAGRESLSAMVHLSLTPRQPSTFFDAPLRN